MSQLDPVLGRLSALHPKLIDLSLGRIRALLAKLDDPQDGLPPTIHVAGTNGKGSTIAFMRAMLEAAGHSVHAYTSPHLVRFNERIVVDRRPLADPDLIGLLEHCERANAGSPITFFEITTAAAFLAFARTPADYLLLEVGLGGRLDTTNVIRKPMVTAISPVSYDHEKFLGDTLAGIAKEKAGIAKPGVPLVLAPQRDEAFRAIESVAARVGAPVYADWRVGQGWFEGRSLALRLPRLGLEGDHQAGNAGLALACLEGCGLSETAMAEGLAAARWPARLQKLSEHPEIWLDGGHNPGAGEVLAAWLAKRGRRFDLVIGMLDTKDREGFLRPLAPHIAGAVAVPVPDSEAGVPARTLAESMRSLGMRADVAPDVISALERFGSRPVLITGSLYLAGAVLKLFGR